MRKRLEVVSVLGLAMPPTPVIIDIEAILRDNKPFRGVSYHTGKRKWRAYLYRAGKQIAHAWCSSKKEAILMRLQFERQYGKPGVMRDKAGLPLPAFPRTVIAPKDFVLGEVLGKMQYQCRLVRLGADYAAVYGMRSRHRRGRISTRRLIGERIGGFMTIVDLLGMAGEIKAEHIEDGMRAMAEELAGRTGTGTDEGDGVDSVAGGAV